MQKHLMRGLLQIGIALVLLSLPSAAGGWDTSPVAASVRIDGLRARAVVMSGSRGVRLRHPAAIRNPDTLRHTDMLRFWCYVPSEGDLRLDIEPAALRSRAHVQRRGTYGGVPMAMVTVDPFIPVPNGELHCVDTLRLRVSWSRPLVRGAYVVPPTTGPVLNPTWSARDQRSKKSTDVVAGGVDPSRWYDPSQPHVRLETTRDGIAQAIPSEIVAREPALRGVQLDQIRLFYRGVQQPIYLADTDGDGKFSDADTLMFLGRHPSGDTTWLDLADTTAVFFVTRRTDGDIRRIVRQDTTLNTVSNVTHVRVNERFEVDSGYYHPGSGQFEDYSTFLTPMSLFEGFYWHSLNARAQQSVGLMVPFTPYVGDSFRIRADIVSSTNVQSMSPDHGIDVRSNGGPSVRVEGDGYVRYALDVVQSGQNAPAGLQTLQVYASGVSGAEGRPDWFSEILVDAVEVSGAAAPVLSHGRLRGVIDVASAGSRLVLSNVPQAGAFVLDTTSWTLRHARTQERNVSVRIGASRTNAAWITDASPSSWTTSIAVHDTAAVWTATRGFFIGTTTANGLVFRAVQSADSAADVVDTTPADAVLAIICAGASPSQRLTQTLSRRGVSVVPTDSLWTWVGANDSTRLFQRGGEHTLGALIEIPAAWSSYRTAQCEMPNSGARYVVVGAGSGIERAYVRASMLENLQARRDSLGACDVIVIANRAVRASAERWARYRAAASNVKVCVVDVESIFAEYDAGRHSPESMRAFLADVWKRGSDRHPTHAILFGSASWDVRGVLGGSGRTVRPDLVPTYGRPSSDYWFGLLDDPNDVAIPEMIVARFPVLTDAEANAVIDKIIQHDTVAYAPADRTTLYVGGGETEDEGLCQIYQDVLGDVFGTDIRYTDVPLCLDTVTVCKSLNATPGLDIRRYLASGVGMMNYIGHGGTEVFDIDGWDPQLLANARYPVMSTFSCLTGAFSNPTALCRNGQYLIEPSRGVVAAMGATGWQYKLVITQLHIDQHEVLRTTSIRDIGRLMYAMKRGFGEMGQQFAINATMQFNLLGDPFTRIRIDTVPELSITADRVVVTSPSGARQLQEDDRQANVAIRIWNEGLGSQMPLKVRVRRTYRGITDSSTVMLTDGVCRDALVTVVLDIVSKVGEHRIEVEVDPDRQYGDRRDDNIVRLSMQVFARSLLVLEPGEHQRITPNRLRARIIDVVSTPTMELRPTIAITRSKDTSAILMRSRPDEFTRSGSIVDWIPSVSLPASAGEHCWIAAWAVEPSGVSTAITWTPVTIREDADDDLRHLEVPVSRLIYATDSVRRDTVRERLLPATYTRALYVRSNGVMTADPDRDPILDIRMGDSVVLRSAFRTGLNIVTFRPSDTLPRRTRRYDTSPNPAPVSTHNGYARECITFLRDSIADHDRVIVAACEESFSRFVKDTLLRELREQLVRLGARFSDSLSIGSSYAFVGSRLSVSGLPLEAWKGLPTTGPATIDTTIRISYATAQIESPVLGPAAAWTAVTCQTSGDVRTQLIGLRSDQTEDVLDTTTTWRPTSAMADIVGVKYRWTLRSGEDEPSVGAVTAIATPLPQWIIEPEAISITPERVVRGDTSIVVVTVRNARTTEDAPGAGLSCDIVDASTMLPQPLTVASVGELGPDERALVEIPVPTAPLPQAAIVRATLKLGAAERQRYAVRDRSERAIELVRDTLPPGIEAYVSGRRVGDNDKVPSAAQFEIRITDNARLPISDPENVVVFVNGIRIRATSAAGYQFLPTDSAQILYPGSDVRAIVRFDFTLEAGENLLIVRATDAFQNSDTLEVSLFPVEDVIVDQAVVMPNPTSGAAVFRADVIANDPTLEGRLVISDLQGRIVSTRTASVSSSQIVLPWDGRSDQQQSLASGLYAWRILVQTPSGSVLKTVSGTLLILR